MLLVIVSFSFPYKPRLCQADAVYRNFLFAIKVEEHQMKIFTANWLDS